jgi:hypothetical protein
MKVTIEAEHACEIIDFLKKLPFEDEKPTKPDEPLGRDKSFLPLDKKRDYPLNEFIDVIWSDGAIGYNQSTESLNLDNVIAYRPT